MWPILIFLTTIFLLFLIQEKSNKQFFESKGLTYLGNGNLRLLLNAILGTTQVTDVLKQYLKIKKSGKKIGVSRDFGLTTLTVADPDLLRLIMVKDFENFFDRRELFVGKTDYLFHKMLFLIGGEKWKLLRTKLSPTFTTGKIKRMFKLFEQSGQKLIKFWELEIENSKNGEIELSEGYSKFTMDIIASAACGIDSQAFEQKESSVFEKVVTKLRFEIGGLFLMKMLAMAVLPRKLTNFLEIALFKKEVQDFFTKTIKDVIQHRQFTQEKRQDFIQLMLESRAGTLKTEDFELGDFEKEAILKTEIDSKRVKILDVLDDEGIVSNCLQFVIAGYETTHSLLLFCAHELAQNQQIQEKLRAEIKFTARENFGVISYDDLSDMPYLDMVVNETLRLYPPVAFVDRASESDYNIPGTEFVLKRGDIVSIPIHGLHHDQNLFPNPKEFDPERFSTKNRNKIHPYTFLPFGHGPRNSIGMRFALTEAKIVIANLVNHFQIDPTPNCARNPTFMLSSVLKPRGGITVRLQKILH